ncbi:glycosyltransferase family 2 protein [Eubacterium sp. MSJ-33]|uniref:glycosyltransferase family 2 protein n=1 Tax=Eubacterium sp. MSJ-33 TaxID=2841528 RepID=UPI001C77EDFB|nr:glycosyltransferase family 2 protein [Eubacterium sp. MSJ-33]QWT54148.1 glycosyltransferase family 2 protein [Eubacterium sp. MSJ-33]
MEKSLTVFTPTYNRAYILGNLYESLKRQTNPDFCWVIVDDGSTDNTKKLIEDWIQEGILDVRYFYQKNSGKMMAHNYGVDMADTELFVCVDSDDYLVPDAVEHLVDQWREYGSDNIAGIIAKRGYDENRQLGIGSFPEHKICRMSSFFGKTFTGDTTLCFRTDVLRRYKFPIIDGEKFLTEAYIYDQIDRSYEYIVTDCILTICHYLDDGYTNNMQVISYRNPVGRMYHEAQNMEFATDMLSRIKAAIRYNSYKYISQHRNVRSFTACERVLLFCTKPAGYYLYRRKKKGLSEHEAGNTQIKN